MLAGLVIMLTSQTCEMSSSKMDLQKAQERVKYLIRHEELGQFIELDSTGVSMFASAKDKEGGLAECRVSYEEAKALSLIHI